MVKKQFAFKILSILLFLLPTSSHGSSQWKSEVLKKNNIDPIYTKLCGISPDMHYTPRGLIEHPAVKKSSKLTWVANRLKDLAGEDQEYPPLYVLKFIQSNVSKEKAIQLAGEVDKDDLTNSEVARRKLVYSQEKIELDDEAQRTKLIEAAKMRALWEGATEFFTKERLGLFAGFLGLAFIFYFLAKYGIKLLLSPMPPIVKESTIGFWNRFKKKPKSRIGDLVYEPKLYKKLMKLIEHNKKRIDIKNENKSKGKKLTFHDLIFQGPPGTGKTLFAKVLALEAGFDYIIVDGPRWSQLSPKEALKSLYALLEAAHKHHKPVLLFIDESDAVFSVRDPSATSEASLLDRKVVNAWLAANIEGGHPNVLIVYATNLAGNLDPALRNRTQTINFPAPGPEERIRTLEKYLNKTAKALGISIDRRIKKEEERQKLSEALKGLTQRQIMQIASVAVEEAFLDKEKKLLLSKLARYIEDAKTNSKNTLVPPVT